MLAMKSIDAHGNKNGSIWPSFRHILPYFLLRCGSECRNFWGRVYYLQRYSTYEGYLLPGYLQQEPVVGLPAG